ncbi:MAG: hypothetical protein ACLPZF_09115, partial [Candidatus Acidiferrales bacterium]
MLIPKGAIDGFLREIARILAFLGLFLVNENILVAFDQTVQRLSTTLRQVFAKFSEFFMCWGFPPKNVAPGSPGSDDLQLGR